MSGLNDPSRAYVIFAEKFTLIYDKCFLLRIWKQDGSIFVNPGLLKALLNLKERNISYTSHSLIPLTLPLKMLITRMTALSFTSSCKAFILWKKKIEKIQSNVKATWRVLNEVLNRSKEKRGLRSIFRDWDSQEISNPREIAHLFCKYFTDTGPNLVG